MTSLNIAKLPGIGEIENPEPEHYRAALRYLRRFPSSAPLIDGRSAWALADTLRRLEWTPKRLRVMK